MRVAALAVVALVCGAARASGTARELGRDPVQDRLAGGEAHEFQLDLEAGEATRSRPCRTASTWC